MKRSASTGFVINVLGLRTMVCDRNHMTSLRFLVTLHARSMMLFSLSAFALLQALPPSYFAHSRKPLPAEVSLPKAGSESAKALRVGVGRTVPNRESHDFGLISNSLRGHRRKGYHRSLILVELAIAAWLHSSPSSYYSSEMSQPQQSQESSLMIVC